MIFDAEMNTTIFISVSTSVTLIQEKIGPHRLYEDSSDEKTGGRGVLISVMKTPVTRKQEKRCPHQRYEDSNDEETGGEVST